MKKWLSYVMLTVLMACHTSVNVSKNVVLSCVLLGYDSMAYYYGNSAGMKGLTSGLLNDSVFISRFINVAKSRKSLSGFKIAIKPTASANVVADFKVFVDLLNLNDFEKRSIDSLDDNEKMRFNTTSLIEFMNHSPKTLILPKEEGSGKYAAPPANTHTLTILAFNDTGLYVYRGTDIKDGKTYVYDELRKLLSGEKLKGSFAVLIKPASGNTYRNTVNILDEMTNNNITDYKLIDITPEEEAFLGNIE